MLVHSYWLDQFVTPYYGVELAVSEMYIRNGRIYFRKKKKEKNFKFNRFSALKKQYESIEPIYYIISPTNI